MQVNSRVRVHSKDALAPYEGTVEAVSDAGVHVRSDDGTVRTHHVKHVVVISEPVVPVAAGQDPVEELATEPEPIAVVKPTRARKPKAAKK